MPSEDTTKAPTGASETTRVDLTDGELLMLDGLCSEKVQVEVDGAKMRARLAVDHGLPEPLTHVLSTILREATQGGQVIIGRERLRHCSGCKKSAGYATVRRSSRYKRKGEADRDKPLYMSAIEYIPRFVRITGYSSTAVCYECSQIIRPALVAELATMAVQVPEDLRAADAPTRVKHNKKRCKSCGWVGHEGEMKRGRTLMNDSWYPAGCPKCPASNTFGKTSVETIDGFVIVETRASNPGEDQP